jgi:uncharacterized repeat protein (TIGR01451 family)
MVRDGSYADILFGVAALLRGGPTGPMSASSVLLYGGSAVPLTMRRALPALGTGLVVASSAVLFTTPAAAAVPGTFTARIAECNYNGQPQPVGASIETGVTGAPADTTVLVRFTLASGHQPGTSFVGTTDATGTVTSVNLSVGGKDFFGADNYPVELVAFTDTNGDNAWAADEQIGDAVSLPLADCPNPPPGPIPPDLTSMGTLSAGIAECIYDDSVQPAQLLGATLIAWVTGGPANRPVTVIATRASGNSSEDSLGTTDADGAVTGVVVPTEAVDDQGAANFPLQLSAYVDRNGDGLNLPEELQIGSTVTIPLECPAAPAEQADQSFGSGGGTVSTGNGTAVSPTDPVDTAVTTSVFGQVRIVEGPISQTAPTGYTFLGQQVVITAPHQSADAPLRLAFAVDASVLPMGETASSLQLFRDGQPIAPCLSGTRADPDPCIVSRETLAGGDVRITALSSHASVWTIGTSTASRTASLSVTATAPSTSLVGSDVTATVTVRNDGPAAAAAPQVTVTLPAGAVPGATLPVGCSGVGPVTCTLPQLAAGATATFALTVTPIRPGAARFGATVATTSTDPLTGDNTTGTSTSVLGVACTKVGTQGNDRLTGTGGSDVICGLGGDDTVLAGRGDDAVTGGSGNDTLDGEAGRDVVSGGAGLDVVRGGDGDDLLDVRDGAPGDSADGQAGRNLCTRDGGDSVVRCS